MDETRPGGGDGPRPELFVLHAAGDAAWVHGYLLPELGLPTGSVRTPADFAPGASRVAELERAVTAARVVVLVLTRPSSTTPGPSWASSWPPTSRSAAPRAGWSRW